MENQIDLTQELDFDDVVLDDDDMLSDNINCSDSNMVEQSDQFGADVFTVEDHIIASQDKPSSYIRCVF